VEGGAHVVLELLGLEALGQSMSMALLVQVDL